MLGCILFAAAGLVYHARAKTVSGRFQLEAGDFTKGPEYEITKYSFSVGEGEVSGKFRYKDPHTWQTSPALYLYNDDSWDAFHNAPACMDKIQSAHASISIGQHTKGHSLILHDSAAEPAKTNMKNVGNGEIEWSFRWPIKTESRTRGWFLVAADCALEQYNAHVPPMEYEITLLNPGNTHLPADEHGLPKVYLFTFFAMLGFGAYLIYMLGKSQKHLYDTHLVVKILLVSYIFQGVSVAYELIHLSSYKYNGYGFKFFDFMSEVLEGMSYTLAAFVLICLASGWTLVTFEYDSARPNSIGTLLRHPSGMLKGANVVVFSLIAFVFSSFALQVWNKLKDDDFTKFHDFESFPGKLIIVLRAVLGVLFIYSFHTTIKLQQTRGGDKLLSFLKRLRIIGGLWFLAFPLIVVVAELFPHYLRHRIVSTGVLVGQTALLGFLGHEFVSEKSTYFRLSTLSDSGVLPGAGGFVRAPKMSRD